MQERVREILDTNARLQKILLRDGLDELLAITHLFIDTFKKGKKAFFFGNGGSAADAQHLAAEFVNRFLFDRRALPAIALTTDTSVLTCIANDSSYEKIFSRQIEALGSAGDIAVGLSTSGNSPNVIEGIRTARSEGLITIAFAGGDGGKLLKEAEHCLLVPSATAARVQEIHILAGHIICELVEQAVCGQDR
jgi:D-sedoheptulose 7-phosphate isomerase